MSRPRGGSAPRVGPVAATERLELRLTPDQRAKWQALAEARGLSLADLIRAAIEHYELCSDAVDRGSDLADLGREVVSLVRQRFPQRRKE